MLSCRFIATSVVCSLLLYRSVFPGSADDYVAYKFQYFSDNNDVQVATNTLTISKAAGSHAVISGSYLVDAVTAASKVDIKGGSSSVDAVTSASRKDERRHQVSGTVSFSDDLIKWYKPEKQSNDPTGISFTGIYGSEPDYESKTGSFSLRQDLFGRNTTVEFSYGRSFDRFMPVTRYTPPPSDAGWSYFGEGKRRTDRVIGSCTQIMTPATLATFTGEYVFDRGYLSRPYYVYEIAAFDSLINDTTRMFYHENLPAERKSMALSAQVNHYLPLKRGASLIGEYRYYRDSWEIESHTVALMMYYRFADNLIINPHYRFYSQRSAFFYKNTYTDVPEYLTTDFKLGRFMTNTVGIKLIFELQDFIKPVDNAFFALFPVSFDIAANYMIRSSTKNIAVRDSHYSYFPITSGYRNFWIQSGIKCAF